MGVAMVIEFIAKSSKTIGLVSETKEHSACKGTKSSHLIAKVNAVMFWTEWVFLDI